MERSRRFSTEFSSLRLFILGAAAMASAIPAQAATPSWQSNPAWANEEAPAPNNRPSRSRAYSADRGIAAPFVPGSNNIALDVGQVFLMGDLASNYADSIGFQLHYTYGVSDLFGFDMSAGYSEHSDGKFSMATLLGGLRTNLAWYDRVVPYLVFGLGFYRPSYQTTASGSLSLNSTTAVSSVAPVLFGVHVGPGVDLQMTRQLFFGAALTFHDVFGTTKTTPGGSLNVGGTFTSFLLHAGFSF